MSSMTVRRIARTRVGLSELLALPQYSGVALALIWTQVVARYKQSVMGLFLIILQPLVTTGIFTFVFGAIAGIKTGDLNYTLFAYAGVVPWVFFQRAVQSGSVSLVTYGGLHTKVFIPRFIAPLTALGVGTVDLIVSIGVFAIVAAFFGQYPLVTWLLLPVVFLYGAFIAASMFLLPAALAVRFRDIPHVLPYATSFLMYSAPVAYPRDLVPEQFVFLYSCNPIVGYIEFSRWALLGTELPLLVPTAISLIFATVCFVIGGLAFANTARTFADQL